MTCTPEKLNYLRRTVADLRSKLSKLQVQYNDLKSSSAKEIQSLKSALNLEKKKRINV